jgi:hypothetical protein
MKNTAILAGIAALFLVAMINGVVAANYFECQYGDNFGYCNTPYEARYYVSLTGEHPYYYPITYYKNSPYSYNDYYSTDYYSYYPSDYYSHYPDGYYGNYPENYYKGYWNYRDYYIEEDHGYWDYWRRNRYSNYCDELLGDEWCDGYSKWRLNEALDYTFRDYNAWKVNTAGRDSGEVYDTEEYYTETAPASNWRYKETYNPEVHGNYYYEPRYDYTSGTFNWDY